MNLDLQNNTLTGFGQCTINGTTGTVVVKPTPGTALYRPIIKFHLIYVATGRPVIMRLTRY